MPQARQILNVEKKATESEVLKAYTKLTALNNMEKGGSKYLQAKIDNARELLAAAPPPPPPSSSEKPADDASSKQ